MRPRAFIWKDCILTRMSARAQAVSSLQGTARADHRRLDCMHARAVMGGEDLPKMPIDCFIC